MRLKQVGWHAPPDERPRTQVERSRCRREVGRAGDGLRWHGSQAGCGVSRGGGTPRGRAGRVRNIGRNFAIYPIYRVYRWGPIFFLSAEIDLMNIFYTKK